MNSSHFIYNRINATLKNQIAKHRKVLYGGDVQQKAVELALTGYNSNGVQPTLTSGFFVRNISMRSHFMVKLERDTFECAGIRLSLSVNPFQFCHPHFNELGETSIQSIGVHHHA